MIDREYNIKDVSPKLASYLEANHAGYQGLRRRAVLAYASDKWSLITCTVEAIASGVEKPDVIASRYYPQAILYEDWLSADELLDFVRQVHEGQITLGEHTLTATDAHRQWSRDQT